MHYFEMEKKFLGRSHTPSRAPPRWLSLRRLDSRAFVSDRGAASRSEMCFASRLLLAAYEVP